MILIFFSVQLLYRSLGVPPLTFLEICKLRTAHNFLLMLQLNGLVVMNGIIYEFLCVQTSGSNVFVPKGIIIM